MTQTSSERRRFEHMDARSMATDPVAATLAAATRALQRRDLNDRLPATCRTLFDWLRLIRSLPKTYGITDAERALIARRNTTFVPPPDPGTGDTLGNRMVIGMVGTMCKVLIQGMNRFHTFRMQGLHDAIELRPTGQGLLTVSNHRSVADDPIMLAAMLPPRILWRPELMRWGLCSADICFQGKFMSRFMMLGKAMPIVRGGGVGQSYVTALGMKLAHGDWVHLYPEGRVRQSGMGYCKRGVGRILTISYEQNGGSKGLPIVLPIYHEGIENLMPQDRVTNKLMRSIPSIGQYIFVMAGKPLDVRDIFEKHMPACAAAGGTKKDPAECMRLYEEIADRLALSFRVLRAELRTIVREDIGLWLGEPFEVS